MAAIRTNKLVTALLLFASLAVLFPLFLTVLVAMKTAPETAKSFIALPSKLYFGNFQGVFEKVDYGKALFNSLVITGCSVVLVLLTNSMVGYAVARNMHRKFFKAVYYYLVSGMFVPFNIIMLPLIKLLHGASMNNFTGLILGYMFFGLSQNVFLTVGYLHSVPKELEESAVIDGASVWQTFWKVIFPLMKPINATISVFTMLLVWNDFLLPMLMIRDKSQMTLPLIQFVFQGQFNTDYGLAFASYLMALLPAVLFYIFAQKWIISGLTSGAVKS
ncbi:carbohydrate ABC transporter permease [Paenibacillus sp. GCM10027626]|uniref:carbohydrate ABC transporter permease n=1 Tax=Paenibacillus sp. GCM10027626 TaxID=3273411 RepID=UPI003636AD7E